jgi:hypothetical protein
MTIGNSVETIGSNAFLGTAISSLRIPTSVTNIGDRAFENAASLSNVIFLGSAPSAGTDVFVGVASGAKAYVTGFDSGFGAVDDLWNLLIVSYDTPPVDEDNPPSDGGSDSSDSTPSLSTSSVATKSVDASFKLTNRKYLSKFEIRKAITKNRSFKRKPVAIYKYSISKASKKNCLMRGNYVMRLKENAVCEITVTRSIKNGIKSKYQVKINYNN